MANTIHRSYPLTGVNDAPDGPLAVQRLGEAVDADMKVQVDRLVILERSSAAEYAGPIVASTAAGTYGFGAFTVVSGGTINNDFVAPEATPGRLKFTKAGSYTVTANLLPATPPGTSNVRITRVGSPNVIIGSAVGGDYGAFETTVTISKYFTANTVLDFSFITQMGVNNGTNVSVVRHD